MAAGIRKCLDMGPIDYPGDTNDVLYPGNMNLILDTGTRWVRIWMRWDLAMPAPGQYNWRTSATSTRRYRRAAITVSASFSCVGHARSGRTAFKASTPGRTSSKLVPGRMALVSSLSSGGSLSTRAPTGHGVSGSSSCSLATGITAVASSSR